MQALGDRIEVASTTRRYVEFLRQSDMRVLFQSVYMVALTHAIQDIEPDDNRKWAEALRKTLEDNNIKIDKDLKTNAYKHAQKLLKYPLKREPERDAID